MQTRLQPTSIRCYSSPVNHHSSFRMAGRESSLRRNEGFESKGVVLLVICGLYAVFLFILARLFSYVASSLFSSVKTVFVKHQVTEVSKVTKIKKPEASQTVIGQKDAREMVRNVCHG